MHVSCTNYRDFCVVYIVSLYVYFQLLLLFHLLLTMLSGLLLSQLTPERLLQPTVQAGYTTLLETRLWCSTVIHSFLSGLPYHLKQQV